MFLRTQRPRAAVPCQRHAAVLRPQLGRGGNHSRQAPAIPRLSRHCLRAWHRGVQQPVRGTACGRPARVRDSRGSGRLAGCDEGTMINSNTHRSATKTRRHEDRFVRRWFSAFRAAPGTVAAILLLLLAFDRPAAQAPYDVKAHYAKREVAIPMRDGVKLFTIIYSPKSTAERYPILLTR